MNRPYLETKVVKVKKKEKCYHPEIEFVKKGIYRCKRCGMYLDISDAKIWGWSEKPKLKGNWVNGENLDKIKFPCFCSYVNGGEKHIGEIHRKFGWYILFNIDKQISQPKSNAVVDDNNLKRLIKAFDIHILKGKIIVFEEVKK